MATNCFHCPAKASVHIAKPATGKTMAMLLLASYTVLQAEKKDLKVVIYSSVPIVVEQLAQKAKMFPYHNGMLITGKWDTEAWLSYPHVMFIFDEAEELISNRLLDMRADVDFAGLMRLKGKKMFLFTATLSEYLREAFIRCFGDWSGNINTYLSLFALMNGKE